MGIKGFSSFMRIHESDVFVQTKLKDTYVVIDGSNNVLHSYFDFRTVAYGGDMEKCHQIYTTFYENLLKCNIIPVVIFDGFVVEGKFKVRYSRYEERFNDLRRFDYDWHAICRRMVPLSFSDVHKSVLRRLGISFSYSTTEADIEIAVVAKMLNCPVISDDTDFYFFDCRYIVLRTLDAMEPRETNDGYFLYCLEFNFKGLEKLYPGLQKYLLPFVPAILGNDLVQSKSLQLFVEYLTLGVGNKFDDNPWIKDIHATLTWLKDVTDQISGKEDILRYVPQDEAEDADLAITTTFKNYVDVVSAMASRLEDSTVVLKTGFLYSSSFCKNDKTLRALPPEVVDNFRQCRISPWIIRPPKNFLIPMDIEDVRKGSACYICLPIIFAVISIMENITGQPVDMKIYYHMDNEITVTQPPEVSYFFDGIDLRNIMNEPTSVRITLVFKILKLKKEDIMRVMSFEGEWILLMATVMYWASQSSEIVTGEHILTYLFMCVANFVQTRVGYHKDLDSFLEKNGDVLKKLKDQKIANHKVKNGVSFLELLGTISELECLLFTRKFIKLRCSFKRTDIWYSAARIHPYAALKHCIYYVQNLNNLLNFPLPEMKPANVYSGTLLYNINYTLQLFDDPFKFIESRLENMPNILNVYRFMCDCFSKYLAGMV